MKTANGTNRNPGYLMPYIGDKRVFSAVMYARQMIREGGDPRLSICHAARYYRVDKSDVAHYVGIAASNVKRRRAMNQKGLRS